MRLESARSLKIELKSGRATTGALKMQVLESARPPAVAIGIAPMGAKDYRIAIRARARTAEVVSEIERITAAAAEEVDVRFTGPILAFPATSSGGSRGVRIGMSVGHVSTSAGTLGCFVQLNGHVGFISCNHVLALEDAGVAGDHILQPGPLDGGRDVTDLVATLVAPFPHLHPGSPTVDCAVALLETSTTFDAFALDGGGQLRPRVNSVDDREDVEKIGRTTGRTRGVISAFDIDDVVVDYPHGGFSVTFDKQIEIESATAARFSQPGDSGAVVFNRFQEPVGLLFATALDRDRSYANHLRTALDALGVKLLT